MSNTIQATEGSTASWDIASHSPLSRGQFGNYGSVRDYNSQCIDILRKIKYCGQQQRIAKRPRCDRSADTDSDDDFCKYLLSILPPPSNAYFRFLHVPLKCANLCCRHRHGDDGCGCCLRLLHRRRPFSAKERSHCRRIKMSWSCLSVHITFVAALFVVALVIAS